MGERRHACADTPVLVVPHPEVLPWCALPAQNTKPKALPPGAARLQKAAAASAEKERAKAHQPPTNVEQAGRYLGPHFSHVADLLEVRSVTYL